MDNSKDVIVSKESIVLTFFYIGMLIAYFGSLLPWFMWPVASTFPLFACLFLFVALYLSHTMEHPVFDRDGWILPLVLFFVAYAYTLIKRDLNLNGYLMMVFRAMIFMALFRIRKDILMKTVTVIAKAMAWLLVFSIPAYFLYLFGFNLPGRDVVYGDNMYSFTNYYFFLLDDRSMFDLVPRFHSVFLEPSHLGMATVLLLFAQINKWKKWYNLVLLVATFMSFSLTAYVMLVVVVFLHLWIKRKNIIGKIIFIVALITTLVVGSFYYNDGDNLLNNLIVMRMEIEDGEMAGDDRVTEDFQNEFDEFVTSGDIFIGRYFDREQNTFGNAGIKVFFYEYGLLGILLILVFYYLMFKGSKDPRLGWAGFMISMLPFIVSAFPFWFNYLIPIYGLVQSEKLSYSIKDTATDKVR
jgi:hypothetical protein